VLKRSQHLATLVSLLKRHPVVAIVGARQVGKTTLARQLIASRSDGAAYFDLENPSDLARLHDPMLALQDLHGLVVVDEVQRLPEIFPVLRVLVDRPRNKTRFLLLGSASPQLIQTTSESLAGRIHYHELGGFSLQEVGTTHHEKLWVRGGFPRSFLALSNAESIEWRKDFVRTFLERDLPQLGSNIRSTTLHRFWSMLAHYHGQIWNSSDVARSFGVADTTVRHYLDLLTHALVIRQLRPWHENISKRQVKSPKVYVLDSGILHALLNLSSRADVDSHPKAGASWEGFVIGQVMHQFNAAHDECFFWSTYAGAELDFLIVRGRQRIGFEVKRTVAPKVTPSMRHALENLKLRHLFVIHAGDRSFPLTRNTTAVPVSQLTTELPTLSGL